MRCIVQFIVAFSCCWLLISSAYVFPHSLSYFNESIGGPLNGPNHLLGSNVDWGQDLRYVQAWAAARPNEPGGIFYLAYSGGFRPEDAGVDCRSPTLHNQFDKSHNASVAISVNLLKGSPPPMYLGGDAEALFNNNTYQAFEKMKPLARIGYSIRVYLLN